MKRHVAWFLAGLFVASTAVTAVAAEPDRYERGDRYRDRREYTPPPPRRGAEVPPPRHAQYGQPYFFAHLGIFNPNDSVAGLDGYDTGMNFDVGVGSRVSPFFAVEGTVGAYGAERGSDEAAVLPMTIGGRLIVPHPFIEPYVGAGLGIYFTSLDEPRSNPVYDIDDSDTTFGGYLSAGVDMWLNQRAALNLEGKYHFVDSNFQAAAGNSFDVDTGGWTVNLGVRIGF